MTAKREAVGSSTRPTALDARRRQLEQRQLETLRQRFGDLDVERSCRGTPRDG